MHRFSRNNLFLAFLISVLTLGNTAEASAAATVLYSALGSGCNTTYTGAFTEANRWIAQSNITISGINYLIGNQSTSGFSGARMYITSDNSATNYPAAILATFTPDVISGSGVNTVGHFVGSQTISAGTKFWIVPSVRASVLPWCYWPGILISNMTLNGVVPDTTTSLSNTLFRKVYSGAATAPIGGTWDFTSDTNQIWQLSIESSPAPVTASLALTDSARIATYRTNVTISANVSSSAKVTFYANKKVISNCRNIPSNAGIASCIWRPSVIGNNALTAKITSTDASFTEFTSSKLDIAVTKRTNTR